MKRTQRTDAWRNIWKQKVSFLSIVVIASMAVMAYLGLNFASRAIAENANTFYDTVNFRDVEIVSSLLVSEEDLKAIRETEGVESAELVWQTSGILTAGGETVRITVVSLTEDSNVPALLEGSLPKTANECIVDAEYAKLYSISVGDSVTVTGAGYLKEGKYKVCGIAHMADLAASAVPMPDNRYITVLPEAFDREALEGCAMKAVLKIQGTDGINRFDKEYFSATKDTVERIKALADTQSESRTKDIKARFDKELAEGQAKLDEAKAELDAAKAELDAAKAQLTAGEREYAEGGKLLEEKAEEIAAAEKQLADAKTQLSDSEKQLSEAKSTLAEGKKQLEEGYRQIEDAKSALRDNLHKTLEYGLGSDLANRINWDSAVTDVNVDDPNFSATDLRIIQEYTIHLNKSLTGNIAELLTLILNRDVTEQQLSNTARIVYGLIEMFPGEGPVKAVARQLSETYNSFDSRYEEYVSSARLWDQKHAEYLEGLAKYNDGMAQYEAGKAEYEAGKTVLASGKVQYEEGLATYRDSRKTLDYNWAKYNAGLEKYNEGLEEYNTGLAEFEKAKERQNGVDPCQWVVLDVNGNPSYQLISGSVKNTSDMGITFALIFILVGALVIYATLGRIVDEQRKLVGATKALGLYRREIFAKYLLFGEGATVIGILLGILLGYLAIQLILTASYSNFYVFDNSRRAFIPSMTVIVVVCGMILSFIAVWSACSTLLRSTAIRLMQDKAPQTGKRKGKASKNKSLYTRLIFLNMLTDKKRVAVTIVSVAGCCALLVAGFNMRFSIMNAIEREFSDIRHYDAIAAFSSDTSEENIQDVQKKLEDSGAETFAIRSESVFFTMEGNVYTATVLCGNSEEMKDYFTGNDMETKAVVNPDTEGIWLYNGITDCYDIKPGDELVVYDSNMQPHNATIAGSFKNYIGNDVIMNEKTYRIIFGNAPTENTVFLKNGSASREDIDRILSSAKDIGKITYSKDLHDEYKSLASTLDLIALLLVAIAGIMAYFIILNLATMHVNQKRRELTIMRVNGFTVREVRNYIARETVATTVAGIILGLGAGSLLGYRVIVLLQGTDTCYPHAPQPMAILIAVGITILFSVIINSLALRKIKMLKLTDIA